MHIIFLKVYILATARAFRPCHISPGDEVKEGIKPPFQEATVPMNCRPVSPRRDKLCSLNNRKLLSMSNAKSDIMEPMDQGAFCYYSFLATMWSPPVNAAHHN